TVEDTDATLEDISRLFGDDIARLVDGVTKLTKLELQSDRTKQAENFRKLVVAMSEDIRVLLVKLADRLHNLRTLKYVRSEKSRRRTASETLEIYAPLAERIGVQTWRDELVDLAFAEINPEARDGINTRLEYLRSNGKELVTQVISELKRILSDYNVEAEVTGREKAAHSIWLKMQRKDAPFEALTDIMAFRVSVPEIADCYQALGAIHASFPVLPGRFKDFISTPKPNGYQSIHTAVIGPEQMRIEVQIRTTEMHQVAEYGVAAHWRYKQGGEGHGGRQYGWIRGLLDILDQAGGPEEFLEHTKLEMYQDQVFCFTPKGDLISLPNGATIIDFAYAVHSEVGDKCVGAKVNGRMAPVRTRLKNGDQVDILTARNHTPSPEWERFVVTGRARASIRRMIRLEQRDQFIALGREVVRRVLTSAGRTFSERELGPALDRFKLDDVEDLYSNLGEGLHTEGELAAVFQPVKPEFDVDEAALARAKPIASPASADGTRPKALTLKGLIPGMAVHYARCCHPLPGDRIVGIVTTGKGVAIHMSECSTLEAFGHTPERWLDVDWNDGSELENHTGRVRVILANEPGSLGAMSNTIGKHKGNISHLRFANRAADFFELMVDIEVESLDHLANIIAALRTDSLITSIEREGA
ncbi:MAG: bifunctional (p)ppGpp synthetase/guanosine-3',5'-bis(diphosphate) 3'-pyrophosphohydrolase, partial [Alphaproteobacteria bacterium]|nr:bifunctional (p)ppGpp synthetase/guanosine-3',5'-bis(diphosphate) 3'-pyrophosphohydrolase [Alphaproteobacteria bacterium]